MTSVNWDCLIVDEQSKSTNGIFVSPAGIRIEVHEDSLRIHPADSEAPVVRIYHGEMMYEDVCVLAERGPNNGIFFVVYSATEDHFRAMAGIACEGFHEGKYVGVEVADVAYLREIITVWGYPDPPSRLYDKRIGQIGFDDALRFNQADAQVAHKVGATVGATAPGEAQTPVVLQALNVALEEGGEKK